MSRTKRTKTKPYREPRSKKARSQFGVVIELSERKIMSPRLDVNPASAFITTCAIEAILNASLSPRRRFLAIAGRTSLKGGRFPPSLEEPITLELGRSLAALQRKSASDLTTTVARDECRMQLRLFDDLATAKEWAETATTRVGGEAIGEVPKESRDALRKAQEAIDSATRSLPLDFAARRAALIELHDAVREAVVRALEPVLNEHVASLPHSTYEEKKTLAKWVNAELRRVGLAIKCPKTGHPCLIVATTGNRPTVGRFVLDYTDEQGKRRHPISWSVLPQLELTLDDLSRVPYGERRPRSR